MNSFLRLVELRLNKRTDMLLEMRSGLTAGFRKYRVDTTTKLFKQRFRAAMEFVAMQSENIIELGLELTQRVLLRGFDAKRQRFEFAGRFLRARKRILRAGDFSVCGV